MPKFYMHTNTGSVDSQENWEVENGKGTCENEPDLVWVVRDHNGEWIAEEDLEVPEYLTRDLSVFPSEVQTAVKEWWPFRNEADEDGVTEMYSVGLNDIEKAVKEACEPFDIPVDISWDGDPTDPEGPFYGIRNAMDEFTDRCKTLAAIHYHGWTEKPMFGDSWPEKELNDLEEAGFTVRDAEGKVRVTESGENFLSTWA